MNEQEKKREYSYDFAKKNYSKFKKKEKEFKMKLNAGSFYVIRFDGCEMTAAFKIKHKAINEIFFDTMKETFKSFAQKYPQIILGYNFSDEISVLFKATEEDEDMFSRGAKLLSILSGQLALEFHKAAQATGLDCKGKDWVFDGRLIELNPNQVIRYFKARQAFAINKFQLQCKSEYGLDMRLTTSSQIISALKKKKIDYDNFSPEYKFGLVYSQGDLKEPFEFFGNEERLQELYSEKQNEIEPAA